MESELILMILLSVRVLSIEHQHMEEIDLELLQDQQPFQIDSETE